MEWYDKGECEGCVIMELEAMQIFDFINNSTKLNKKDYLSLIWSASKTSTGSAGCFLKAEDAKGSVKKYYKLSRYSMANGIFGHESLNEKIVSNLGEFFHFNSLHYNLITSDIKIDDKIYHTDFTVTDNFVKSGERKISFENYYYCWGRKEPILDFCDRIGILHSIAELIILDFITGQRDRHGANVELLESSKGIRLAPIYDNGVSFLFSCYQSDKRYLEKVKAFDVSSDFTVQSFLGGYSLFDNLNSIKNSYFVKHLRLPKLEVPDWDDLFKGLDQVANPLDEEHLLKIWEMVEWRVLYYDRLCCS